MLKGDCSECCHLGKLTAKGISYCLKCKEGHLWELYKKEVVEVAKDWIKGATQNKGGLHQSLGIPTGQKIPAGKLAVKPGDSTKVQRQKNLAKTLKGF